MTEHAKLFYEKLYDGNQTKGVRRYPHDEMMRFIGRHFFSYAANDEFFTFKKPNRSSIKILDAGCGAGSNLWAIAKEGFSAYGMDFSVDALVLCEKMLAMWDTEATLSVGDMRKFPYEDNFFDGIVEIYSSCALLEDDFNKFLKEVSRTLKVGGKFYCWNPSSESEAFLNHAPAKLIEPYTLDGIKRESSPFFGNSYSFRFLTPETATKALKEAGLEILEIERNGRTYRGCEEYFEWLSISAIKVS